ncbi:agamous-like MADS-box protein AGL14 [Solanum tuberosum]|uniref:MADS-box protein AGL35 n=1 Tax=Solanum tuberosum TaxID=4113 RepID=M1DG31_SOLTU|nr:PREDICTED: agamous-like MADS-box protein AGL14 [Solanum tuberosum]
MSRNKVNYALIEDASQRKVSGNKRLKGLLKKSDELKTLCDVEVATVIYDPYRNEPYTFPNNDIVPNTFIKFKELPTLERSKNMVTREEFTMQRIKKLEEQLQKVLDSPIPSPMMDSLVPSPMIDSPMPSLMMAPPMYSPVSSTMTHQMEPTMDIPSIGVSTSMNNNQNPSVDLPDSPTISGFLNWKDDVVMTLFDVPFLKNINVQDPNHTKKF